MFQLKSIVTAFILGALASANAQTSVTGALANVCRVAAASDACSCSCISNPYKRNPSPWDGNGGPVGNGGDGFGGNNGSGGNPFGFGNGGLGNGIGGGGGGVSPQAAYQAAPGNQNPTIVNLPPPPGPVTIQQQPRDLIVQGGGTQVSGSLSGGSGLVLGTGFGGVQCAPDDLVCLVFTGDGDSAVTHCPYNTTNTWYYRNWEIGAIRPYYLNQGPVRDIYECKDFCDKLDDCYFATLTGGKNCWLLTTTDASACPIAKSGHYGKELIQCTRANPCPSAYKRCARPYCTLESIRRKYCLTGDKQEAVTRCVPQ